MPHQNNRFDRLDNMNLWITENINNNKNIWQKNYNMQGLKRSIKVHGNFFYSQGLKLLHRLGAMFITDRKVHGAHMGPTWVLSAPDGPYVGPMNFAIRDVTYVFGSHFPSSLPDILHSSIRHWCRHRGLCSYMQYHMPHQNNRQDSLHKWHSRWNIYGLKLKFSSYVSVYLQYWCCAYRVHHNIVKWISGLILIMFYLPVIWKYLSIECMMFCLVEALESWGIRPSRIWNWIWCLMLLCHPNNHVIIGIQLPWHNSITIMVHATPIRSPWFGLFCDVTNYI